MYPFKSQNLMKSAHYRNKFHIIEVFVTLVSGFLPGVIIVSISGYQYSGFPPVCANEIPELMFYTLIFPISIGATFSFCMLLVSIVILRKASI